MTGLMQSINILLAKHYPHKSTLQKYPYPFNCEFVPPYASSYSCTLALNNHGIYPQTDLQSGCRYLLQNPVNETFTVSPLSTYEVSFILTENMFTVSNKEIMFGSVGLVVCLFVCYQH